MTGRGAAAALMSTNAMHTAACIVFRLVAISSSAAIQSVLSFVSTQTDTTHAALVPVLSASHRFRVPCARCETSVSSISSCFIVKHTLLPARGEFYGAQSCKLRRGSPARVSHRCRPFWAEAPWTRPHHRSISADMSVRADEATLSDAAAAASSDVKEKSELLVAVAAALTLQEHYDTTGAVVVPPFPCKWHV